MLQEKTNLIEVVGLLSEVNIEEKSKDGKDYLTGQIVIKTTDTVDGAESKIDIPFPVYAGKLTKAGDKNPAYESLMKVKEKMTSIAACGDPDKATVVRAYTEKGGLRENTWFNQNTNNVSTMVRPNVSFFNAVDRDRYANVARFETTICVLAIDDEVDKDGIATGRLKIGGAVPGWDGKINRIDYVVNSPAAVEHIKTYWEKGDTVIVAGVINYTTTVEEIVEEMGFGEPLIKHRTRSKRELVITKGSQAGLDADQAFNTKEILEGVQARKLEIEKKKEEGAHTQTKPSVESLGF